MKRILLISFLFSAFFATAQISTINVGTSANDRTGDPVRTAFQKVNANDAYLEAAKAALASPAFTGTPTAPTAASSVSTTQVATTAFVHSLLVPTSSSGTAIAFDVPRTYGYVTAETGNITLNSTGLREGVTQLLIHNHSSEPTFPATMEIISGEYVINVPNYILLHAVKSNLILVTISQEL